MGVLSTDWESIHPTWKIFRNPRKTNEPEKEKKKHTKNRKSIGGQLIQTATPLQSQTARDRLSSRSQEGPMRSPRIG